jgi:hypothetical protein
MGKVYLMCLERHSSGANPYSVTLYSNSAPIKVKEENVKMTTCFCIETNNSPRHILERLEKIIFNELMEKPSSRDSLYGNSKDFDKKNANVARHITYAHISGRKQDILERNTRIFRTYILNIGTLN